MAGSKKKGIIVMSSDEDDDFVVGDDDDDDEEDDLFDTYSSHSSDHSDDNNSVEEEVIHVPSSTQSSALTMSSATANNMSLGMLATQASLRLNHSNDLDSPNISQRERSVTAAAVAPPCSLNLPTTQPPPAPSQKSSKLKLKLPRRLKHDHKPTTTTTTKSHDHKPSILEEDEGDFIIRIADPRSSKKRKHSITDDRSTTAKKSTANHSTRLPSSQTIMTNPTHLTTPSTLSSSSSSDKKKYLSNDPNNSNNRSDVTSPVKKKPKPEMTKAFTPKSTNENDLSAKKMTVTPTPSKNSKVAAAAAATTMSTKSSNSAKSVTPTPSKKKKRISFQDQVWTYMWRSMKPMTLKSLAQQFRTTETTLYHLMLTLVDKGMVWKKTTNKKKDLYWANLDYTNPSSSSSPPDVVQRQEVQQTYQTLTQQYNSIQSQLSHTLQQPTNEQLDQILSECQLQCQQLQQQVTDTKQRIQAAQSNQKTSDKLTKQYNLMRNEWKNRKIKCTDFTYNLADALEKKTKDVIQLLDIETDEDHNVKLPPPLLPTTSTATTHLKRGQYKR